MVQGLLFEWAIALAVLGFLGVGAFVFYLAQAFVAVRLLEPTLERGMYNRCLRPDLGLPLRLERLDPLLGGDELKPVSRDRASNGVVEHLDAELVAKVSR